MTEYGRRTAHPSNVLEKGHAPPSNVLELLVVYLTRENVHGNTAGVEVSVELSQTWIPARHGLKHRKLVSVVQTYVLVGRPEKDGIDAAIYEQRIEVTKKCYINM